MSTAAQVTAIQTLRRRVGLGDDADYRGFLQRYGGAPSSKALSTEAAGRVIEELKRLPGAEARPAGGRGAAATATGPYAGKLRALWISAWNLGLVRSGDDRAMLAFVARQTGLAHTRFLVAADDATRAITGLRDWIARDGGVAWPASGDAVALKWAVARAVAARLQAAGGFVPIVHGTDAWPDDVARFGAAHGLPAGFTDYAGADWDALIGLLGRRLRATQAEAARKAAKGRKAA